MFDRFTTIIASPIAWLSTFCLSVLSYFEPIKSIVILMLSLVAVDFITGVWASRKSKIPCSSRRLRKSFSKLVTYLAVLVLLFMIEDATESEWVGVNMFIAWAICMVEFISICENLYVISELPMIKRIVKAIRGKAAEKYGTMGEDILAEKNDEKPTKTNQQ